MTTGERPRIPLEEPRASLSLLDYRRRVADLYATVRSLPPRSGHAAWCRGRDEIFRSHPQSPIPFPHRDVFTGLPVWEYDPGLRFEAALRPADGASLALPHSGSGSTSAVAWAAAEVVIDGRSVTVTIYRLDQYGEGLLIPFRDGTSGDETYGGGRYLIDTAKGADLGSTADTIVLDFNFAYHPSCVHDPRWSCPLAPAANHLPVPIRGGERFR